MNNLAIEKKLKKLIAQRDAIETEISQLNSARLDALVREFARKNKIPTYKVGIKPIPPYYFRSTPSEYKFRILSEQELVNLEVLKRDLQLLGEDAKRIVECALGGE